MRVESEVRVGILIDSVYSYTYISYRDDLV